MNNQSQDALGQQLFDVTAWARYRGLHDGAEWIRSGGLHPISVNTFLCLRNIAIQYGCYDADNWMVRLWANSRQSNRTVIALKTSKRRP